jgi:hypothetical protein
VVPELGRSFSGDQVYTWKCVHLENFARRRVHCCYKLEMLEEIYCYYKRQKHGNSQHSGKKPPSEQKFSDKGKWPILKSIVLSTKMFCITNILAGSFIVNMAA